MSTTQQDPGAPPMGDNRWVFTGTEWELSRITEYGTLVIPKPDYYGTDTKRFWQLVETVAAAHGLDAQKSTGIKSWEKTVAIHFR